MKLITAFGLASSIAVIAASPAVAREGCGPGFHRAPNGMCRPDRDNGQRPACGDAGGKMRERRDDRHTAGRPGAQRRIVRLRGNRRSEDSGGQPQRDITHHGATARRMISASLRPRQS